MTHTELCSAIHRLILETPTILAAPEDALYFRSSLKKSVQKVPQPVTVTAKREDITTTQKKEIIAPKAPQPIVATLKKEMSEPKTPQPTVVTANLETAVAEIAAKLPAIQPLPVQEVKQANGSLRSLFQKLAPNIAILQDIPNDAVAKKIATRWKTKNQITPISILSFHEPPKQKALLIEISKAIDIYFGPAKLIEAESIEKEKQWDTFLQPQNLKCIIACDYTLWQLSHLMQFYKENSSTQERTLQGVSLFLLPDLSLYLKDPPLKRSLWKALCQKLSS